MRDDGRAKLRSSIKRLLVKYKYPPDKQPEAIKLVIEQMEARHPGMRMPRVGHETVRYRNPFTDRETAGDGGHGVQLPPLPTAGEAFMVLVDAG